MHNQDFLRYILFASHLIEHANDSLYHHSHVHGHARIRRLRVHGRDHIHMLHGYDGVALYVLHDSVSSFYLLI